MICGDPEVTHQACAWNPTSSNLAAYECVCADGYIWWGDTEECIEDLCAEAECPEHSECDPLTGDCICDDNYVMEGEVCVFSCNDDEYEDNDTSDAATSLALDSVVGDNGELGVEFHGVSAYGEEQDRDWYSFDLEEGEVITINVLFLDDLGDIDIRLWDYAAPNSGSYDYERSSASSSDNEAITGYVVPATGTYYLQIYPYGSDVCNPYDVQILKHINPCDAEVPVCGDPDETHMVCEWNYSTSDPMAYECFCEETYIWDEELSECVNDLCYEVECFDNAACDQGTGQCVCDSITKTGRWM